MERFWIAAFITFTYSNWASPEQVYILQTPECKTCTWSWDTSAYLPRSGIGHAWDHPAGQFSLNRYTACGGNDIQVRPNRWLRSGIIQVGNIERLDVTIRYFTSLCKPSQNFCNESFYAYVWESNNSVTEQNIPHPINSFQSYRRFATIRGLPGNEETLTMPLLVKSRYIVLGFRDQGGCRILYSVKVSYKACPGKTLEDSLVSVQRTSTNLNSIPVKGTCSVDAEQTMPGTLIVLCESDGEWNTSSLERRCVCKEGMENTEGICTACTNGKYNEGVGFNCTDIPSEPRNAVVSFVNETSAVLTWLPPKITGTQTNVFYDVDCPKSCEYFGNGCDDETCDDDIGGYKMTEGLTMTSFTATNLSSFGNYTCKISSKNRVSKVAKRTNFTLVNVETNGTVPGKPEDVTVQLAEDDSIRLSWILKCKNGIIQEYRVTYFSLDDSSVTKTLTTRENEIHIKSLAAKKTFEFQVYAVNNFGIGSPGVKRFQIPSAVCEDRLGTETCKNYDQYYCNQYAEANKYWCAKSCFNCNI